MGNISVSLYRGRPAGKDRGADNFKKKFRLDALQSKGYLPCLYRGRPAGADRGSDNLKKISLRSLTEKGAISLCLYRGRPAGAESVSDNFKKKRFPFRRLTDKWGYFSLSVSRSKRQGVPRIR